MNGSNGQLYLNNLLSLLTTHYIQNYSNYLDLKNERAEESKFSQAQVDKINQFIEDNIGKQISVEILAERLNCSKFYFLREFKKFTGQTPYQHLMSIRLEQAKTALSQGNSNIAQVAHQFGFNDQSHFTRAFKNQFNVTPGQFVKR